jgi:hypothetical protein
VIHNINDARYEELERHLTLDERVLRDTLGSERGQKFTTTRSMLRILLSRYTGIEPG